MGATISSGRRVAAALAAASIIAVLSGCAPEPGNASPDVQPQEQADVETPASVDPPPTVTGPDCLVGSWELRNETFEAALSELLRSDPAVPPEILANLNISLSGSTLVRFAANGDYGAWQDNFSMLIGSGSDTIQHTQNSADIAEYEVDGDRVFVRNFEQLFVESEMRVGNLATVSTTAGNASLASISLFGHTADVATESRELGDGSARYDCGPTTLSLHADGFPSAAEFTRVADVSRE